MHVSPWYRSWHIVNNIFSLASSASFFPLFSSISSHRGFSQSLLKAQLCADIHLLFLFSRVIYENHI